MDRVLSIFLSIKFRQTRISSFWRGGIFLVSCNCHIWLVDFAFATYSGSFLSIHQNSSHLFGILHFSLPVMNLPGNARYWGLPENDSNIYYCCFIFHWPLLFVLFTIALSIYFSLSFRIPKHFSLSRTIQNHAKCMLPN